jgi:hypothetical protein
LIKEASRMFGSSTTIVVAIEANKEHEGNI